MVHMKREKIVTGLDIGSSKVSAVTVDIGLNTFNVLAEVTCPSNGIDRGAVVDLNAAVGSVSKTLEKIREKVSGRPGDIYVNISGKTVRGAKSKGMIPLSMRGREVTGADMDRCINAASTIHLPFDRDIIHKIVQCFSIDDQSWISDPLGLYASRLSCEVYIITADVNHMQNIHKCVTNAGYDVKEVVFTGIADGSSLLHKDAKEGGAVVLDMGASLTEVSVFVGSTLNDLDIVAQGAQDIKGNFRESPEFDSIVYRVGAKLQEALKSGIKVSAIIVTGGFAFTDGVIEYLEAKLMCPVRMGVTHGVQGDISSLDSMRLSGAIGLARYAYAKQVKKAQRSKNVVGRISSAVVDIFNNYF